jgi:hypothetical protein
LIYLKYSAGREAFQPDQVLWGATELRKDDLIFSEGDYAPLSHHFPAEPD